MIFNQAENQIKRKLIDPIKRLCKESDYNRMRGLLGRKLSLTAF